MKRRQLLFTPPSTPHRGAVSLVAFWLVCGGQALAQQQDRLERVDKLERQGQRSELIPTLALSESYLRGTGAVDSFSKGEFVTRVSPGLNWTSRSGRVQGSASYVLDVSHYSQRQDATAFNNTLSGALQAELIDQRAFVDVQANVGQGSISAFGQQSGGDTLQNNANRTEVASISVSPYVRGTLGTFAEYQLRLAGTYTDTRTGIVGSTQSRSALAALKSPGTRALFGWGLTAQRQEVKFQARPQTTNDRVNAELNYRPDSDLLLFVNGGRETTDVLAEGGRGYNNWGAGLRWTPSARTTVALQADKRYFGNSHKALIEYRTPRTIWRYSDSRDSTAGTDASAFTRPPTIFQLYFEQFASIVPDPALRDQTVREFLRLLGRDPNETIGGSTVLSTSVSVLRRRDLSVAWTGLRTAFSLQAFATDSSSLGGVAGSALLQGRIRQSGATASLSYRLTPVTSITANGSRLVTSSNGTQRGNDLTSTSLTLSSQLSRTMGLSLSTRYAEFDGPIDAYREASATASLNLRF